MQWIDMDLIKNEYKIGCNGAFLHYPCDDLVFLEHEFLELPGVREKVEEFTGDIYTQADKVETRGMVHHLPKVISLSGYEATKVGLEKAKRVYLLGCDMCEYQGETYDPKIKYYAGNINKNYTDPTWLRLRNNLWAVLPRDRVFNVSQISSIPFFKKVTLDEAINGAH